jgi:hypothetical protein
VALALISGSAHAQQGWNPGGGGGGGSGTVTSVGLNPGLTKTIGTQNTGSDAITTTGTISGQTWPVLVAGSCTVNTNCNGGNTNETGELLIANAASITFTLPNPAAGTEGSSYFFGSDGTNGYTLTTAGGAKTLYGCPQGGGTSLVVQADFDVVVTDDGTNYKCTLAGSPVIPLPITYAPGINPNNLPIANINQPRTIVGIRCNPEVAAGGSATITFVKAASGTALSAGTALHSGSCNANGTAATDQTLTVTVTTLAAGDRLGITTTGTTIWTSSGIAAGVGTVFVR